MLLFVATASRIRRRCKCWQLLVIPLLCGGNFGDRSGVSGLSAALCRKWTVQVAGPLHHPHLGSLRRRNRAAFKLWLHKPRCHVVQVWYEGWVLNSSWKNDRN